MHVQPENEIPPQDGENKARKVAIYSVDTHPMDGGKMFCTAGRDQYVRLYDRRYISATQIEAPPMKKFCPHHLVRIDCIITVTTFLQFLSILHIRLIQNRRRMSRARCSTTTAPR